jgi:hypothetical protein
MAFASCARHLKDNPGCHTPGLIYRPLNKAPGARDGAGVAAPEMTEIQTRLLAERGPAVLFENVVRRRHAPDMPVLVNLFGTSSGSPGGMDREPHELRGVGETPASAPARAARRLARGADMLPGLHRDGDEAQNGNIGALPGDRAQGRRRSRQVAGPDLLAG